ncbi:MAG: 3-phosphoshikimate 1-carboxyvinyltransferase, partial [Actinomycetota bacterium]
MTEEARVRPSERPLRGEVRVPTDKSISHRAALIAAIAAGRSIIRGFSPAGDCASTLAVLSALGVTVAQADHTVIVDGLGDAELRAPAEPLDCGRSGTTMRLVAGLVAPHPGPFELSGDEQLRRRPMERVAVPLRAMGAAVTTDDGRPP